jgi:hypothetical protein
MKRIDQLIADAIASAKGEGLEPRSIYLTPADRVELTSAVGPVDQLDGLAIKPVSGRGRSRLYCKHGIARALPAPPRARRTPLRRRRRPAATHPQA